MRLVLSSVPFSLTVFSCFAVVQAQQNGSALIGMSSITKATYVFEPAVSRRLNIQPGYGVDFRDPESPVFTTSAVVSGGIGTTKNQGPNALCPL